MGQAGLRASEWCLIDLGRDWIAVIRRTGA
jgi:hypothetical protein